MKPPLRPAVVHWLAGPPTVIPDRLVCTSGSALQSFRAALVKHPAHMQALAAHPVWSKKPMFASRALTMCVEATPKAPHACAGPHIAQLVHAGGHVLPQLHFTHWIEMLGDPAQHAGLQNLLTAQAIRGPALGMCLNAILATSQLEMLGYVCWEDIKRHAPIVARGWVSRFWDMLDEPVGVRAAELVAQNHPQWIASCLKRNVISWDAHDPADRAKLDLLAPHLTPAQTVALIKRFRPPAEKITVWMDATTQQVMRMSDDRDPIVCDTAGCPVDMPNLQQQHTRVALNRATRRTAPQPSPRKRM